MSLYSTSMYPAWADPTGKVGNSLDKPLNQNVPQCMEPCLGHVGNGLLWDVSVQCPSTQVPWSLPGRKWPLSQTILCCPVAAKDSSVSQPLAASWTVQAPLTSASVYLVLTLWGLGICQQRSSQYLWSISFSLFPFQMMGFRHLPYTLVSAAPHPLLRGCQSSHWVPHNTSWGHTCRCG